MAMSRSLRDSAMEIESPSRAGYKKTAASLMPAISTLFQQNPSAEMWQSLPWTICSPLPRRKADRPASSIVSEKGRGHQCRHYRRLILKQVFAMGNTLLDGGNVIDFPIHPPSLNVYDEALEGRDFG